MASTRSPSLLTSSTQVIFFFLPSVLPVAILWLFATAGGLAGGQAGLLARVNAAQESRQLIGDRPLNLVQQTASHVGALSCQGLEVGDGVDAKEVTVSIAVGQVKFADVGLGQDGFENVELVRVVNDLLEDQLGVAEEAHLLFKGLDVAVDQQAVDAHTDSVLANKGNFVLHAVLDHLVQIFQEGDLLSLEELTAGVGCVVVRPEGADVDAWGLCHVDERRQAPEECAIHSHQILGCQAVSLVQDDADLGFATLQLPEEHLQLQANVQLGGVKDHEDQVSAINEPLANIIERVAWKETNKPPVI